MSSRCWLRGSTSNGRPERPEQVDLVAGPQPREPVGPAPDDPEVDRDDAGRRRPWCSARTAGAGPSRRSRRSGRGRTGRRASRSRGPARGTPGATGPGRISRLSTSSAAASRMVTRSGGPPRPRRRRRPSATSSPSSASSAVLDRVAGLRPRRRRRRSASSASSGRHRRERLGQRVGQVAEDVGRVVELDELLGAGQGPPLPVGLLGHDLGAELAGRGQHQPLVVVVDDDQVTEQRRTRRRPRPRTRRAVALRCAGCAPGTRARGRTAVGRPPRRPRAPTSRRLAGRPRVGGGGVRDPRRATIVSSGEMPAASIRSSLGGRLRAEARRLRGRPRRRPRRCRPGCTARRARTADSMTSVSLTHSPVSLVLEAAAAAEREVGRDRQVVGLLVDEGQATVRWRCAPCGGRGSAGAGPSTGRGSRSVRARHRPRSRRAGRCGPCPWCRLPFGSSPGGVLRVGCSCLAHRSGSGMVFEVGAHALAEEHRVVAFEDPFAGPVAEGAGRLVAPRACRAWRSRAGRAGSRCRSPSRARRCTSR